MRLLSMGRMVRNGGERGFTLLEVLVAVAILGTSVAVLLTAVHRSLELGFKSKALVQATALAQKRIAEIELEGLPEAGESEGVFEEAPGYRWHQVVEPYTVPVIGTELSIVTLVVTWGDKNDNLEVSFALSEF